MAEVCLSYYSSFEILAQVAPYNMLRLGMPEAAIVCENVATGVPERTLTYLEKRS